MQTCSLNTIVYIFYTTYLTCNDVKIGFHSNASSSNWIFYTHVPINIILLRNDRNNFLSGIENKSVHVIYKFGDISFRNFTITILSGIATPVLHTSDMLSSNSNNDMLQHQITIFYIFLGINNGFFNGINRFLNVINNTLFYT